MTVHDPLSSVGVTPMLTRPSEHLREALLVGSSSWKIHPPPLKLKLKKGITEEHPVLPLLPVFLP
jgi:hypothetical protein